MSILICGADTEHGAEVLKIIANEDRGDARLVTCQQTFTNPSICDSIICDFRDESDIAHAVARLVQDEHKIDLLVWAAKMREDAPFAVMQSYNFQDHVMMNALAPFILARYLTRFHVMEEGRVVILLDSPEPNKTNMPYFVSMNLLQALARSSGDFFDGCVKIIGVIPPETSHPKHSLKFAEQLVTARGNLLTGQVVS